MGKHKSRGNGQGTAYKRKGQSTWTAEVTVGWKPPSDDAKKPVPVKKTKGGFKTKREALEYCAMLRNGVPEAPQMILSDVYAEWAEKYAPRIVASTMAGYKAAYQHFSSLHCRMIHTINAQDLQDCMDKCPAGKRTHQMMKVIAGLIWGYAYDKNLVQKDITVNLYTGKGKSEQRQPLTDEEVEAIRSVIGKERYADYIYALCYLGFRPGEFLELKKSSLSIREGALVLNEGIKTEAGIDRSVIVPPTIGPIIADRMRVEGTDLLFPQYVMSRKKEFLGFKQMSDAYFRESVFKPLMKRLGIAEGKAPYSARHTYSDKLKDAKGEDKAKAALMGHTDYKFTQSRYQSTDIKDLKTVVGSLK